MDGNSQETQEEDAYEEELTEEDIRKAKEAWKASRKDFTKGRERQIPTKGVKEFISEETRKNAETYIKENKYKEAEIKRHIRHAKLFNGETKTREHYPH